MKVKCFIHTLFLAILLLGYCQSHGQSYGLLFASTEVVQDKRTGLDLSPGTTLCFDNSFDLSFELSVLPNRLEYFGYIVRLIDNDKRNIDLIYDNSPNHFKLIIGEKLPNIVFNINSALFYRQWNKIQLKFDHNSKTLTFVSGSNSYSQNIDIKKGKSCYKILFGANNYGDFQTTDVPPMKIRNITLTEGTKLKYQWKLDEEQGNTANETVKHTNAEVLNPQWIKKLHYEWQLLKTLSVEGPASVAFNPANGVVQVVGFDSLLTYNTLNHQILQRKYESGRLNLLRGNESLYDSSTKKLYNLYVDQRTAATFDFTTNTWDLNYISPTPITDNWLFNKFYSPEDSSLYMIGGYGHFIYKNTVRRWHLPTKTWEVIKTTGDSLTPRYLASLGRTTGGAYILGGYGSASGQQILNPKNLYDLVYFNTADKSFKKLYELQIKGEDFVFGNSLVIDEKTKSYYGLVLPKHKYNSSLQLITGSLTQPTYKLSGSTIPYKFHDINSFADLYYCPLSESLIAVTLFRNDNNITEVTIYALSFPPQEITGIVPENASSSVVGKYWYIWLAIALLVIGAVIISWRKAKKKSAAAVVKPAAVTRVVASDKTEPVAEEITEIIPVKNAILLFGDLQLFDSDGADITKFFTPLIKELFLVILLYTIRWERGISSEKLKELLWFDKSEESARNNRSVNIVKLKSILDKMKFCEVSKETGYWKINVDYSQIQVDYHEYLNIVKDKQKLNKQKIQKLAHITQRGGFLSNDNYEWLDAFKSEISNEVIDTYLHFANSINISEDPEFLIKIANYIFYFDAVNEEAMIIKCKALVHLGKHSLAKNTFENFNKEYKLLYGEEFGKEFQDILA